MSEKIIVAIIEVIGSLIIGFITGYQTCIIVNKKQIQKAKNNSVQIQVGEINGK